MDTKEKVKVFIINGPAMSGKDAFVEACCKNLYKRGFAISTVDFIKDIAKRAGWDGVKTPESRKYLSDLKVIFNEWLDASYKGVKKKIEMIRLEAWQYNLDPSQFYLFVHCREPEEIERFKKDFGAKTIYIHRPGVEPIISNKSDADVANYNYDFIIENDGTLEDLENKAVTFINAFKSEKNCPYCGHHIVTVQSYCPLCDKEFGSLKFN